MPQGAPVAHRHAIREVLMVMVAEEEEQARPKGPTEGSDLSNVAFFSEHRRRHRDELRRKMRGG